MWKGQREWVAHNGYGMQLDKKGIFRSFLKKQQLLTNTNQMFQGKYKTRFLKFVMEKYIWSII